MIFKFSPLIFTVLLVIFSIITMVSNITIAKSTKDDTLYKNEYNLSVLTSVICGISVLLSLFILILSYIKKDNLLIELGASFRKRY